MVTDKKKENSDFRFRIVCAKNIDKCFFDPENSRKPTQVPTVCSSGLFSAWGKLASTTTGNIRTKGWQTTGSLRTSKTPCV